MNRIGIVLFTILVGCMGRDASQERTDKHEPAVAFASETGAMGGSAAAAAEPQPALARDERQREDAKEELAKQQTSRRAASKSDRNAAADLASASAIDPAPPKTPAPGGAPSTTESPTRAWFPETFLFRPLVVTDAAGKATVSVRVPDRLTTWRVLGLAHSRDGAQGGATTSFLGTLPTYVDLVVPPELVVGDSIRLPIQIVNTTAAAVATSLAVTATGAELAVRGGARTVPAAGSLVDYATLTATRAGTIEIRAALAGGDAVLRTIEVRPAGRPVTVTRSGTLAAPRTVVLEGPGGVGTVGAPTTPPPTTRTPPVQAPPARTSPVQAPARTSPVRTPPVRPVIASDSRARLLVFPGALAVLRSELTAARARDGVAETAYTLLLAGRAPSLLAALGDKPESAALRELAILAGQRAIRDARTLDLTRATLLAEAALAHPSDAVLTRLGERAAAFLATEQRPDGTYGGGQGWTLQRVLVTTAEATRAVGASGTEVGRHRAQAVRAKAAGAFERMHAQVEDPYTAAAMLASGAVRGELAVTLRARVKAAIQQSADGARFLDVGTGVVRPDGSVPSRAEATALAALALRGEKDVPLADLGATLLGAYNPYLGWSDGRGNLACMQAVVELFAAPVPPGVTITLKLDGAAVATGVLDREKLREVLVLDAPVGNGAGPHTWEIIAEPPVAGLGYSLAVQSFVPWEKSPVRAGLELALPADVAGTVGKPLDIAVTAVAPAGMPLHITQALPAGVQVDRPSVEALVADGKLERFTIADGKLELWVSGLSPGQTFDVTYRAIPTLAGTLRSGASKIASGPHEIAVAPTRWVIR